MRADSHFDQSPNAPGSVSRPEAPPPGGRRLAKLSLAALGVVYGDIGTSPLYAVRECFFGAGNVTVTPVTVLGVLSLIFWALVLVISVKYLLVVMRADNNGEGGILALLASLDLWHKPRRRATRIVIVLGMFGAALLYADGMLTPAISVLSAMEGLEVAAPSAAHAVLPGTVLILLLLFWAQRKGTARIGGAFGPIVIVWFAVIGTLGLRGIMEAPRILGAINPSHALRFFIDMPTVAVLVLGGVYLVVTGGEALYADMGHFGKRPIRLAWFVVVLPGLLLNYFGQGAYILVHPAQAHHPFYNLVPHWGVYPMIALATVVTVIASQAVISGTFSLTRQAIQLGQSPPLTVIQTSSEEYGQIYVPAVNKALAIATLSLVIAFGSSSGVAGAYGVALSATMVITTVLIFFAMRDTWHWPSPLSFAVAGGFLSVDAVFFAANIVKIREGGWVPLVVGIGVLILMSTWRRGRELLFRQVGRRSIPIETLVASLRREPPVRVPGTAVFLTGPGENVPASLLHHLKLNRALHEKVILVTAVTRDIPSVPAADRLAVREFGCGFFRMFVYYGFMQGPNIPVAIKLCADQGIIPRLDADTAVYYAARASLILRPERASMALWRKRLFSTMARNSQRAIEYFRLPVGRSVELGIHVEI
ncbi:MAG: KUP/HAK/KT family potassium transporter [Arenicellales bacterium]